MKRKIVWNPAEPADIHHSSRDFEQLVRKVKAHHTGVLKFRKAAVRAVLPAGLAGIAGFVVVKLLLATPEGPHTISAISGPAGPVPQPQMVIQVPLPELSEAGSNSPGVILPVEQSPVPASYEPDELAMDHSPVATDSASDQPFVPPTYTNAHPLVTYDSLKHYFNSGIMKLLLDSGTPDQVQVTAKFRIDTSGRPSNIRFSGEVRTEIREGLVLLIAQMPDWAPATANGSPVQVWVSLPLVLEYDTLVLAE